MYNSDTELMFPPRLIPLLRDARGVVWQKFIEQVGAETAAPKDRAAFTLLMVRLGGCQGCSIDSYRGMRGCTACARQTIRRYRGNDEELIEQFFQAQKEIDAYWNELSSTIASGAVEKEQRNGNS